MGSSLKKALGELFLVALVSNLIVSPAKAASREVPAGIHSAVDAAIARMKPALVRIHVVSTEYREGRELKMQAVGSGAIITKDGYVVTNHHVAGHATRLVCTLSTREEIEAELIGTDPLTDISIIKLKPEHPRDFTPAAFGDSTKIRVGDWVLAMGSPMALSQSVTLGIISNVEMIMPRFFGPMGRFRLDGEDVGALLRWLGHDAAIYGGNSGGPLVNLSGEIVGINEISFGLSGAIPGNLAHTIADQIIAHGKIARSWVGIDVQPRFKHDGGERGVLVSGVLSDSPASRAGLTAGDIILSVNGTPTNVRYDEQMPDFMRLLTSLPLNKEASAMVLREGKESAFHFTPVERGDLNPPEQELKQWGLTVRNLSFLSAKELKRTNQNGVLITSVRPGGPAGEAKPGMDARDILVEVNGTQVNNLQDLLTLTKTLTEHKTEPTPVIAAFEHDAQRYLTVVKVGVQELRDPGLEVSKAWLAVETHVISRDIAKQLGQPGLKGFYITEVYPSTPAAKAGLRPGDFITGVDDEKLTASGPEHEDELAALIRQYDIGATVQVSILRNKTSQKIPVELIRSPKLRREMKKYRNDDFEFTVRDVAFFDSAEEQWKPDQGGAIVEEVKPGSWAELGQLYVDDLILAVNGHTVKDVESLKGLMQNVAAAREASVVFEVRRGIHTLFLELEPAWPKTTAQADDAGKK